MGRVSQEELNRLKAEVTIQAVLQSWGLELVRHGAKDLACLCPLHEEKTPSFVVTPEKQLWKCFGACNRGGDVFNLVQALEGVSFRQAVELLRSGYPAGGMAGGSAAGVKHSTVPKLPCPFNPEAEPLELLGQVMDYYHETLTQRGEEAQEYLRKRGVSLEAAAFFKLGYSDRTLCYRLPGKNRKAGALLRGKLQELGLIRESGHELFRGSVVVPMLDEQGRAVHAYGRKIRDDLREGTEYHLNLGGKLRGVFNVGALLEFDEVIVCEAVFDALAFWSAGLKNVVATRGAGNFTAEYLEAFVRHGVKRALLAFDPDKAGDEGAEGVARRLMEAGVECFRVQFPRGMDANAFACAATSAAEALSERVRKAVWMGAGAQSPRGTADAAPTKEPASSPPERAGQAEEKAQGSRPEELISSLVAQPKAAPPGQVIEPREPAASPLPLAAAAAVQYTLKGEEVQLWLGNRFWRIKGMPKNSSLERLQVSLHCTRGEAFHLDRGDLYSARWRGTFIKQASSELGAEESTIKGDLGRILLLLEELHERTLQEALAPKSQKATLSEQERSEALGLLKEPKLMERILLDFEKLGMVGERTNKLFGYLAATSRKLDEPLAIIVQSASAAGKTALMDAVLSLMPEEDRVKYSAMTGQSLFYMGETDLQYKILAIVEEAGAQKASYALKLLQSEGEISIASTGKDGQTGKLITREYRVKGPVMIFLTTTSIELDEELQNRCVLLCVDDGRKQTRAIHQMQRERETLSGLWAKEQRSDIIRLHQNAQRLLRPLAVVNPYARELTFLDDRARLRRDHKKYLVLIRAIALLRQYQKPLHSSSYRGEERQYIEVEPYDIELANSLAHETLGRSLDELLPQSRRMLLLLHQMVSEGCEAHGLERSEFRFTRRDIRAFSGWSDDQVRAHIEKLIDLEYVLVHRGGRGQSFVYELLYDGKGQDGKPFVMGLLNVETLGGGQAAGMVQSSGGSEAGSGVIRGAQRTSKVPSSGVGWGAPKPAPDEAPDSKTPEVQKNAVLGGVLQNGRSYAHAGRSGNGSRPGLEG